MKLKNRVSVTNSIALNLTTLDGDGKFYHEIEEGLFWNIKKPYVGVNEETISRRNHFITMMLSRLHPGDLQFCWNILSEISKSACVAFDKKDDIFLILPLAC